MRTIGGKDAILLINGKVYGQAQSISWVKRTGEEQIFGVDSPFAQEIAPGNVTVSGSVKGLAVRFGHNLRAMSAVPRIQNIVSSPYITITVRDRVTGEEYFYAPKAKVTNETGSIAIKGLMTLSFEFISVAAFNPDER